MKFDRAVVASALLLASGGLHAYQIIEGRYRVEVSPGTYEDQLVVRCDDGRVAREQALEWLAFVGAGDEPYDAPRRVDHGQREREPRPTERGWR